MKKNSLSRFQVILHAFNKRGFFAVPLCPVFSVRPEANYTPSALGANYNYGRPTPVPVRRRYNFTIEAPPVLTTLFSSPADYLFFLLMGTTIIKHNGTTTIQDSYCQRDPSGFRPDHL